LTKALRADIWVNLTLTGWAKKAEIVEFPSPNRPAGLKPLQTKPWMRTIPWIIVYCHGFGGLKPPALAGSFSISS
jgi:hypothetical protein